MKPLYELTDYINNNLKGRKLRDYQLAVQNRMMSGDVNLTVKQVVMTYNEIPKEPVGPEWIENLRARQGLWFEKYGDKKLPN